MYIGNTTNRKCLKCNKTFYQQEGTIAIKSESYNKCPYCNGKTEVVLGDLEKKRVERAKRWKEIEKLASRFGKI